MRPAFYSFILFLCAGYLHAQTYTQSGGTATLSGKTYSTSTANTSAITLSNSAVLTISASTVTTSGNTSSEDSSNFYGVNAGVLVKSASTLNMTGCNIRTTGSGANGVFSTGANSTVVLTNDTIYCSGSSGHGIDATIGGKITANNCSITTTNGHGAAYATDRGGGTIIVNGGIANTTGTDSPGLYSTGTFTVKDAVVTATNSEGFVIEGANSIALTNTSLSGANTSRGWGGLIYQSMSGDATGTQGTFTMTGGALNYPATTGPAIFVTNSTGVITLTGVTVSNSSSQFIKAASGQWGTSGSNGGTVTFTADKTTFSGSITCDNISSISLTFKDTTNYTGLIDSASLSLDATSKWTLTGTSYIRVLSDASGISGTSITNIVGNGYNIYYNKNLSGNSSLGGKNFSLVNGGYLLPYGATAAVNDISSDSPAYKLEQNFPNPFNPDSKISYQLAAQGFVSLKVYNINGAEVATLVNEVQTSGEHEVIFKVLNLPSGLYIYRLQSGNYQETKKMILLK
jgi:hypothetical protein